MQTREDFMEVFNEIRSQEYGLIAENTLRLDENLKLIFQTSNHYNGFHLEKTLPGDTVVTYSSNSVSALISGTCLLTNIEENSGLIECDLPSYFSEQVANFDFLRNLIQKFYDDDNPNARFSLEYDYSHLLQLELIKYTDNKDLLKYFEENVLVTTNSHMTKKYLAFRSLGKPEMNGWIETIKISPEIEVNYLNNANLLRFVKKTFIDGLLVEIILEESGQESVWSDFFLLDIVGYDVADQSCYVQHSGGLNFCLENKIITSLLNVDKQTKSKYTDLDDPVYLVKFNEEIKLDYYDFPSEILRYFKLPGQKNPHEVMFLNLELETI